MRVPGTYLCQCYGDNNHSGKTSGSLSNLSYPSELKGLTMKCPHCQTEIHGDPYTTIVGNDSDGQWGLIHHICPACKRIIIFLVCADHFGGTGRGGNFASGQKKVVLAYPRCADRPPPPAEVPREFAEDYSEASLILADSPKASAALSRRCLQHILRSKANVKPMDLAKEIEQVISSKTLPTHLAEAIDAVRNIGNFAAHPIKSTASGEVISVELGEAEWTLDVLEGLFDFYFVQPATLQRKRAELNAKLASANKPPMK